MACSDLPERCYNTISKGASAAAKPESWALLAPSPSNPEKPHGLISIGDTFSFGGPASYLSVQSVSPLSSLASLKGMQDTDCLLCRPPDPQPCSHAASAFMALLPLSRQAGETHETLALRTCCDQDKAYHCRILGPSWSLPESNCTLHPLPHQLGDIPLILHQPLKSACIHT